MFIWFLYQTHDVKEHKLFNVALILSQKQNYILLGDTLLPVIKHGFLRSEENVNLNNFPTLDGV